MLLMSLLASNTIDHDPNKEGELLATLKNSKINLSISNRNY